MSWREGWVCGHVGAEGGLKVSRALWARQSGRRGQTGTGRARREGSRGAGPERQRSVTVVEASRLARPGPAQPVSGDDGQGRTYIHMAARGGGGARGSGRYRRREGPVSGAHPAKLCLSRRMKSGADHGAAPSPQPLRPTGP